MNTKQIGDVTEAMVTAALLRAGKVILRPVGDNQRYDLIIDESGAFKRVQCKTGRLRGGAIIFHPYSSYRHRGRGAKHYRGDIEFFGVYCPETDKSYLVPVADARDWRCSLRVKPTANNQSTNIRWAKDYAL